MGTGPRTLHRKNLWPASEKSIGHSPDFHIVVESCVDEAAFDLSRWRVQLVEAQGNQTGVVAPVSFGSSPNNLVFDLNPSLAHPERVLTEAYIKERAKMANDNYKPAGLSRRNFIKGAAIAAGGTVLGGAAASAAPAAEVTVLGNAPGPMGKGPSGCDGSQDLALINGKFLTLDDKNSVVSAVAIRNGRIAEVGGTRRRSGHARRRLT